MGKTLTQPRQNRALLVEDDPFMRGAVTDFLTDMEFEVVAVATYRDALDCVNSPEDEFGIAVVDLSIPRETDADSEPREPLGLAIVRAIKATSPETGVVVWSAFVQFLPEIISLVTQGYSGLAYVPKGSQASTLRTAIERVQAGDVYFHGGAVGNQPIAAKTQFLAALQPVVANVVKNVANRLNDLSPRQRKVVELMVYRPTTIAEELGLKEKTVRNYQDAIFEQLGLRDPLLEVQNFSRGPIIVLALTLDHLRHAENERGVM